MQNYSPNYYYQLQRYEVKYLCLSLLMLKMFALQVAVAEVNFPSWAKAVDLMYPRALKMTLKPRHILVRFFCFVYHKA